MSSPEAAPDREVSLRRPDFDDRGYRVELSDGVRYCFPSVRFRVMPDDDGRVMWLPSHGPDLDETLDIVLGVSDSTPVDRIDAKMRLAAALLKRNYCFPKGVLGRLLEYRPGEEASEDRMDRITSAILGRDPDAAEDDEEETPEGDVPKGDDAPGATPTPGG